MSIHSRGVRSATFGEQAGGCALRHRAVRLPAWVTEARSRQARARELRAQSWTLREIADELGVAKASVSVWVRDVEFVPSTRMRGHPAGPRHPMRLKKEAELRRCREEADEWIGELSDRDLAMFCLGLYAGEGSKTDGVMSMANTNPRYLRALLAWLRSHFDLEEGRFRARLYLHEGLDLDAATEFWSERLGVPAEQFQKPYRAVPDSALRSRKHPRGCATVVYSSSLLHRRVMAMIEAIASRFDLPG